MGLENCLSICQPPFVHILNLYKNSYTKWILLLDIKHKTIQLSEKISKKIFMTLGYATIFYTEQYKHDL